ncbi:MAG: hypothetical protein P4L84_28145 [Isosphaeraceae bacterium]|nr:hypothetical protein [Isosphaeraceae bacterium]
MMLSSCATFSPGAVQDLLSKNFLDSVPLSSARPQLIDPQPVPEPATSALRGPVAAGAWAAHRGTPVAAMPLQAYSRINPFNS